VFFSFCALALEAGVTSLQVLGVSFDTFLVGLKVFSPLL